VESDAKALGHTTIPAKVRVKNLAVHYTLSLKTMVSLDINAKLANRWFVGGRRRQGCRHRGVVTVGGVPDGVERQVSPKMARSTDGLESVSESPA
jgi:hypothetical protein